MLTPLVEPIANAMTQKFFGRLASSFLILALIGIAGFLHPVMCFERDGRVRLEMNAAQCCAIERADPHAAQDGPSFAVRPNDGDCSDCTDLQLSTHGLPPSSHASPALPGRVTAMASCIDFIPAAFSPFGSEAPPPLPPLLSSLRC